MNSNQKKKKKISLDKRDVASIISMLITIFSIYRNIQLEQAIHDCDGSGCAAAGFLVAMLPPIQILLLIIALIIGIVCVSTKKKNHKFPWLSLLAIILAISGIIFVIWRMVLMVK